MSQLLEKAQQEKKGKKKLKKIFTNSKIVNSKKGYFVVDPMPNKDELDAYYENTYWERRGDKHSLLRVRDLIHWKMLRSHIFFEANLGTHAHSKKMLNFGAGHGGVSILAHCAGFEVFNYDYKPIVDPFSSETYQWIDSLDGLNFTNYFDLIYCSHSLEHVLDVDTLINKFSQILNKNGLLFIEVPNCDGKKPENRVNGGYNGEILPPHTYYFSTSFFQQLPFKLVVLQGQDSSSGNTDVDETVIRYIGRAV